MVAKMMLDITLRVVFWYWNFVFYLQVQQWQCKPQEVTFSLITLSTYCLNSGWCQRGQANVTSIHGRKHSDAPWRHRLPIAAKLKPLNSAFTVTLTHISTHRCKDQSASGSNFFFTRLANYGWSMIVRTVFVVTQIPSLDCTFQLPLGFQVWLTDTNMSIIEESWSESSVNHCQQPGLALIQSTLSADTTSLGGGGRHTNNLKALKY